MLSQCVLPDNLQIMCEVPGTGDAALLPPNLLLHISSDCSEVEVEATTTNNPLFSTRMDAILTAKLSLNVKIKVK